MYALYLGLLFKTLPIAALLMFANAVNSATVVLVKPADRESRAVSEIFEGIRSRDPDSTLRAAADINDAITDQTSLGASIIVLGESAIDEVRNVLPSTVIVGGGFYGVIDGPRTFPTLSLEPSLETVVLEIRKTGLVIDTLRTVVSDPDSVLLNDLYTRDTASLELELDPIVANSERGVARAWFDLLNQIETSREAVLISDETYIVSSGTYEHIIETAWKRNILVVSTLPQYSRRGVSIGFIPDLYEYGQTLHDLMTDAKHDTRSTSVDQRWTDVSVLNRVFNQRTLEHIGLGLPRDLDRLGRVDLVIE